MTSDNSASEQNIKLSGIFSSDLSLAQQKKQLKYFIADFSEKLKELEDSADKEKCAERLSYLQREYARIQLATSKAKPKTSLPSVSKVRLGRPRK